MVKRRPTSVVILITLAELAFLAAFGLLFAYRGKVGELGVLRRDYEKLKEGAKDVPGLIAERDRAKTEVTNLQARLEDFNKYFAGKTAEEAGRLLEAAAGAEARIKAGDENAKKLAEELAKKTETLAEIVSQLQATNSALADLQRKWEALPPNVAELGSLYRDASNKLAGAGTQLVSAGARITELSNRVGELESGEVAIRRELIGLPTNELRRVIFVVDTSSSMRNSPAWTEARTLMRMWVEYLSVEECVLVNFNDKAVPFPKNGYHKMREGKGSALPGKKQELLDAFDRAQPGVYSDMLKGLKTAYSNAVPDMIVMFTDGHPHITTAGDTAFASEILKEVAKHPKVPILTVAVGSYEVEGAGGPRERANAAIGFLKRLARSSGGSFIGR